MKKLFSIFNSSITLSPEDGFNYWRQRIFFGALPFAVGFGILLYIITVFNVDASKRITAIVIDTLFLLTVLSLVSLKKISVEKKVSLTIAASFVFSVFIIFYQGPFFAGLLILFSLPVVATIFLDKRASAVTLTANVLFVTIIAVAILSGLINSSQVGVANTLDWIVLGSQFLFLNVITTVVLSVLVWGLEETLEKVNQSKSQLNFERMQLMKSNEQLQEEVKEKKVAQELLKESQRKAAFYEYHDSLTGLPNKDMFYNRLNVEIMKAKNRKQIFAVLSMGLDKFKNINNVYGTQVGDKLLIEVGDALKELYREDDLVARFSGDRFMVLLADMNDENDMLGIVHKTFDLFSKPFIIEDHYIKITTSIGIAMYPNDGEKREELVENSEMAMYNAKNSSHNSYRLFDYQMNADILVRMQMEKEIQDAIINSEFVPFFQPKVNKDGKIIGMESLIRWFSPVRGMVPPFHFIPIAEKNGMIIEVGKIILRLSCEQNRLWQNKGFSPLRVAVNLSPFELRQPDLIDNIKRIVDETELESKWLELEITESGIMENEKEAIKKLNDIHDLGISISIDDFGTGYSSLSKLKDYPVDTLKVDKSFVDNVPGDKKAVTIVTSIIDLAHNLDFKVVAEGVETQEQLDFLVQHGCDQFQGYFFSKPLSPNDFEQRISNK